MTPAIGDILHITFLDHCEDGSEAMAFEVFGRLLKKDKNGYHIGVWIVADHQQHPTEEKTYFILRRAVTSLSILVPANEFG